MLVRFVLQAIALGPTTQAIEPKWLCQDCDLQLELDSAIRHIRYYAHALMQNKYVDTLFELSDQAVEWSTIYGDRFRVSIEECNPVCVLRTLKSNPVPPTAS